jgi:short-subunit dehydrogenase
MERWRDKWALITGASAGIGAALASELAASGTNLVLTARRQDRLTALADELRAQHHVAVEICAADLTRAETPASLFAFTQAKSIPIALLVNNAGFGAYGELRQAPVERLTAMTQVNVTAVVALTRLYLPQMIERGGGDILILASTAAFQAVPYMSTYAATKAFDLLFAEGLAEEVRGYGVRVCALCPGTTQTEFAQVAGRRISARAGQSASAVARLGLKALADGNSSIVSGIGNRLGVLSQRIAPRHWVARITGNVFRPRGESGH